MAIKFNMYGCIPCPECNSEYRCVFNDKPDIIQCDDCGKEEKVTPSNYEYANDVWRG